MEIHRKFYNQKSITHKLLILSFWLITRHGRVYRPKFFISVFLAFLLNALENIKNNPVAIAKLRNKADEK